MDYSQQQLKNLNVHGYSSLIDAFEKTCSKFASRQAFHCLGQTLSFAQLDKLSRNFSAYLLNECELEYGDRVAIQLPNLIQYPIVAWGILRAGLVIVNTNPLYTPREMLHQFNDSGAKLLVVLSDLLPKLESIIHQVELERVITTDAFGLLEADEFPQSSIKIESLLMALEKGAEYSVPIILFDMDDLAVLQYTGGTTGVAKGAMLSQGNLFAATRMASARFDSVNVDTEVSIAPMPLYHVYGFAVNIVSVFLNGGLSVLVPNPRDTESLIKVMQSFPFTGFAGVNTLFSGLMQHPAFTSIDFRHLKVTIAGGTTLVKEIAYAWEEKTGNEITEGYGLSESAASGCVNSPEDNCIGTVGKKLDYMELKVINENGNALSADERGQLVMRGPHIMQGYWQRPEATEEVLDADGWFKTGDVAIIQEDGFVRIVDRIKDMIIVSGFNVYPNEIEAVVYSHPDIVECAAIGIPDAKTGEAIRLFIVTSNSNLSSEAVIQFCREQMTAYKIPKQIVFKQELPKSPVGKILRRALRNEVKSSP